MAMVATNLPVHRGTQPGFCPVLFCMLEVWGGTHASHPVALLEGSGASSCEQAELSLGRSQALQVQHCFLRALPAAEAALPHVSMRHAASALWGSSCQNAELRART